MVVTETLRRPTDVDLPPNGRKFHAPTGERLLHAALTFSSDNGDGREQDSTILKDYFARVINGVSDSQLLLVWQQFDESLTVLAGSPEAQNGSVSKLGKAAWQAFEPGIVRVAKKINGPQESREAAKSAFAVLYEHYQRKLTLYFKSRGLSGEHAEDMAANVFVKVIEKIEKYEDRGIPFSHWLFSIANNLFIDHKRSAENQRTIIGGEIYLIAQNNLLREEPGFEEAETLEALGKLPKPQQRLIRMRLQGLALGEMGMTLNAAKKLSQKANRNLIEILSGNK